MTVSLLDEVAELCASRATLVLSLRKRRVRRSPAPEDPRGRLAYPSTGRVSRIVSATGQDEDEQGQP
jgi:hypothetical protein